MGNFVFNSPGRYNKKDAPPFSFTARLLIRSRPQGWSITLRLYPIVTNNRLTDYQPRFVTDEEFETVRGLIAAEPRPSKIRDGKDAFGRYLRLRIRQVRIPARVPRVPQAERPLV